MRPASIVAAAAAAALMACGGNKPTPATIAIICQASAMDSTGAVTATREDTVTIRLDSVGGDPRPCKAAFSHSGALTLNGK